MSVAETFDVLREELGRREYGAHVATSVAEHRDGVPDVYDRISYIGTHRECGVCYGLAALGLALSDEART